MSTESKPYPNLDLQRLTSADIERWFRSKLAASKCTEMRVGFDTHFHRVFYAGPADCMRDGSQFYDTLEDAISAYLARIPTPASIAAKKREEARKLLEEAAALDNTDIEKPVYDRAGRQIGTATVCRNLDAKA